MRGMTETNAERIRNYFKLTGDVEPSDIEWLIEQPERARELERNIKLLEGQKGIKTALNNEAVKIIEEKEQENKRLREALRFYANGLNYAKYANSASTLGYRSDIERDGGVKAREASK